MTTLDHARLDSHQLPGPASPGLSTAWMPLDGLIGQWANFGAEATSAPALQATSAVFAALARETEALAYHTAALHPSRVEDIGGLDHSVDELSQARRHWTEALLALDRLVLDRRGTSTAQDAIRLLVRDVMEQRVRLALLIHQVEREHLLAYLPTAASRRKEERR